VNYSFIWLFEGSIKVCTCVWKDPGFYVSVHMEFCMVWACIFCMCVCVCVCACVNWVLVFLYFESSSCHDVRETERETDLQTHQTGHTSHTDLSIYWQNNVSVVCFYMCEAVCVCFACQWLALLCIFGCCGDNVATGDISFELAHSLSLSFSLFLSLSFLFFPKFPG